MMQKRTLREAAARCSLWVRSRVRGHRAACEQFQWRPHPSDPPSGLTSPLSLLKPWVRVLLILLHCDQQPQRGLIGVGEVKNEGIQHWRVGGGGQGGNVVVGKHKQRRSWPRLRRPCKIVFLEVRALHKF